jgi:hypothetical protein
MQLIINAGDPQPYSVIGKDGRSYKIADGRQHELGDGRIVYELGDCNAISEPRPMDMGAIKGFEVDDHGILCRRS